MRTVLADEWRRFVGSGKLGWTLGLVLVFALLTTAMSGFAHLSGVEAATWNARQQVPQELAPLQGPSHPSVFNRAIAQIYHFQGEIDSAWMFHRPPLPIRTIVAVDSRMAARLGSSHPSSVIDKADRAHVVLQLAEARYALAHHLPLRPSPNFRVAMNGARLVNLVFSGPGVLLPVLIVIAVAGDLPGSKDETGTGGPLQRTLAVTAKGIWLLLLTAAIVLAFAGAIWLAGDLTFGTRPLWPVLHATWQPVGSSRVHITWLPTAIQVTSMSDAAMGSVAGSLLPILGVVAAAGAIGSLWRNGMVARGAALLLAGIPLLFQSSFRHPTGGPPWLVWLPGTYLPMGSIWRGTETLRTGLTALSPALGLGVGVVWIALAWGVLAVRESTVKS